VLFRRRNFIEAGTKKSVTDRLGKIMSFLSIQALKPILVEPKNIIGPL